MGIEIKVEFSKRSRQLMRVISKIVPDTREGIRRANYLIGRELVKDAKLRILRGKKTGVIYRRKRPSGAIRRHRSSAPGESPANFSGALRASVGFIVQGNQLRFGAGGVSEKGKHKGKEIKYARALELGAKEKNLAPRPYLIAAIKDEEKIVRNFYKQYIKKYLSKRMGAIK